MGVLGRRGGSAEDQEGVTPSPLIGRQPFPHQWMAAQDPTSALFMLDDHAKSMDLESLDIGLSTMMNALDQARGVPCEIFVPTS